MVSGCRGDYGLYENKDREEGGGGGKGYFGERNWGRDVERLIKEVLKWKPRFFFFFFVQEGPLPKDKATKLYKGLDILTSHLDLPTSNCKVFMLYQFFP